ncbi:hypothetical protein [Dinghuibacter silviterrae]|uniref:Uncharacterized protein n=1 Tax=Dinghuibacter silviterrae TaxID=1539049 RepID=A0A4R8DQG2_9BACT|nr:hypothetical protein [Dinghuibacter silviterrae]TDX00382.1 hypothetical protein EDB95_1404 [Dinghuibacter silviterrae]
MFEDYQKLVFDDYQRKKTELPYGLSMPSPAKLKKLCAQACTKRFSRKDGKALNEFFGEGDERLACLKAIGKCPIDRFRPLVNYLKKDGGIATDTKNIELLAWLIDFEHRPFDLFRDYSKLLRVETVAPQGGDRGPDEIKVEVQEGESREDIEITPFNHRALTSKFRVGLASAMAIIFVVIGVILYEGRKPPVPHVPLPDGGECMYWNGDYYEQISCKEKPDNNALVIPLDSERFADLRKITEPDTITDASIGRVWYFKKGSDIEYFTSGGDYPADPTYRLLPITAYMIRKHIHPHQEMAIFIFHMFHQCLPTQAYTY